MSLSSVECLLSCCSRSINVCRHTLLNKVRSLQPTGVMVRFEEVIGPH